MKVNLCRPIKTNGLQCHGAQLSGSSFCYFHNRLHRSHDLYRDKVHFESAQMAHPRFLPLPAIEDRESAQLAISCVINALATGCIDTKLANALFYGLQLASANARGLRIVRRPTQLVRDIYKEPWVTIPDASPDIAPPGRTIEIEEPVCETAEDAKPNPARRDGSSPPHRTPHPSRHRAAHPSRHRAAHPSRHPERSEGPLYFARSATTSEGRPATNNRPHPSRNTRRLRQPATCNRQPATSNRICSRISATLQSTEPRAKTARSHQPERRR